MPTRTIFLDISPMGQAVFYGLALLALAICFGGFYRRAVLWRQGRPSAPVRDWRARAQALWAQVAAQRRTRRRKFAGRMHALVFYGMAVLFAGTCIVAVEHYGAIFFGNHWFYRGGFYLACKVALDLFGLGVVIGTVMALWRRAASRPSILGHSERDYDFLVLLLLATLTGFLLEGAGIAADPARWQYAAYSPIGRIFAWPLTGITPFWYSVVWWAHVPLVLAVIAALPYGRWLHLFVIPATVSLQPDRPMGALEPVSLTEIEKAGRIGLAETPDLSRWQLMSLDGCMECGRCTHACPAHAVGKELDPKVIVLDLRRMMELNAEDEFADTEYATRNTQSVPNTEHRTPNTDRISDASLWACTNCHACVRECPALIRHVDLIDGIRRYRVAEGRLAGSGATMLRQLGSRENPWGLPNAQRMDWAKGMEVREAAAPADGEEPDEVLLWVGCAGAFDPRAQKTVRALAQLLQRAGVRFSVLGARERCTGDPARRMGDELLWQQLAEQNVATLNGVDAKRIVTHCPHCFNTFKNEYPQVGGQYEVLHHTQYLAALVNEGRLKLPHDYDATVTYHDPCFLARVNRETAAPRELLSAATSRPIAEVARREDRTFCCGAGGGRMWMEEEPNRRPAVARAKELLKTDAGTVAVACPFCKIMVGDGIAQVAGESAPPVLDVAEVMLAAVERAEGRAEQA